MSDQSKPSGYVFLEANDYEELVEQIHKHARTGKVLQHGSIVLREYKWHAIMGTPNKIFGPVPTFKLPEPAGGA